MKAFVNIDPLSRMAPSRPTTVRAEDSYYWAHQTPSPYHLLRVISAAVLFAAIILTVTILRVWLVT